MFGSDNLNAMACGLDLDSGYVEFWPKVRKVIACHAWKVCVLLAIYSYLKTANRATGLFSGDDKFLYKVGLFCCVLAFLYAYKQCQKYVTSGLIFHLYSVLTDNLSVTSDLNAMDVLFNQLDDAICLGSEDNFMYRPELHPKPRTVPEANEHKQDLRFAFRALLTNASLKTFSVFCYLLDLWPFSLLVSPYHTIVSHIKASLAAVTNSFEWYKRIIYKNWERISSVRKRVWKRLSNTSRKSVRH